MPEIDDRFRSFSRTRAPDLWREIEHREPGPLPAPPARHRALAIAVAFLVAAVGIGAAALTFGGSEHPKRTAAAVRHGLIAFSAYSDGHWQIFSGDPSGGTPSQLSDLSTDQGQPAWSPTGSMIAFTVQRKNGRMDIAVMNEDGSGVRLLTSGPGWNYQPAWSPDGSRIAFVSNRDGNDEIYVMSADGSSQVRLTDDQGEDLGPAWSPDGTRIAFQSNRSGNNDIYAMNVDGDDVVDLTKTPGSGELDPAWSPDGTTLAFVTDRDGDPEIYVMASDGSSVTRLTTSPAHDWNPAWSPNGSQIAFESDRGGSISLFVMNAEGSGIRAIPGLPGDATSPSWQPAPAEETVPAPSRPMANGPIYFRVGGGDAGRSIDAVEPDGSGRRTVFPATDVSHRYSRISFSPDGTRIAFDDFPHGIVTTDADGSHPVRLTDGVNDSWATWSPDGKRILFSSTSYDPAIEACEPGFPHEFRCPTDIYVMDADGSNVSRLTDDVAGEFMPQWSPDGSRIAFVREGDPAAGTYESIFTMAPEGTDVHQISSASGGSDFWPSWSPDGSQIAFAAIRREDWGIWVVSADGSNEHMILGGMGAGYVDNPVWSPDGTLIAFVGNLEVDDYSPDDALYVMNADGSSVTPIADAPRMGVAGDIAWQPVAAASEPTEAPPSPAPSVRADVTDLRQMWRSTAPAFG